MGWKQITTTLTLAGTGWFLISALFPLPHPSFPSTRFSTEPQPATITSLPLPILPHLDIEHRGGIFVSSTIIVLFLGIIRGVVVALRRSRLVI